MDIMHAMKDALMKYETIDAGQIDDLMERKAEIREPAGWGDKPNNPEDNDKPQAKPEVKVEEKPVEPTKPVEQSTSQEATSSGAPEKKDSE